MWRWRDVEAAESEGGVKGRSTVSAPSQGMQMLRGEGQGARSALGASLRRGCRRPHLVPHVAQTLGEAAEIRLVQLSAAGCMKPKTLDSHEFLDLNVRSKFWTQFWI